MAGPAGPTLVPNLAPKWLKQTFDAIQVVLFCSMYVYF